MPTDEQKEKLSVYFGCARFVYNLGLECKIRAWKSAGRHLGYNDLAAQMKELKDTDAQWLQECPAQALQMSLRNLDTAYSRFFKGGGFPKFKSKRGRQSVQFPQSVSVDFDAAVLSVPKLRAIPVILHRRFSGNIKTVTISKTETGRFFVSILVDNQAELPAKFPVTELTTIGIDVGLKSFATLSNGSVIQNPKHLRQNLKRLRIEQRKLNRRFRKGTKEQSKSYKKQKLVVAKLHEHIRNQRENFLHQASIAILRSFDTVCLEDLNIKGMLSNRRLSLSISDAGWFKFKTMLEYKAEWYGKNIRYIDRFAPSSKECNNCGNIFKELNLKDRYWTCSSCGTHHDRDENAANNIKRLGLRNKPSTVNVSQ